MSSLQWAVIRCTLSISPLQNNMMCHPLHHKGRVGRSTDMVDSNKGMVGSNKGTVDSNKGTVDSNKGTVDSSKGTVDSSKGTADSRKGTADSSKGTADSSKDRKGCVKCGNNKDIPMMPMLASIPMIGSAVNVATTTLPAEQNATNVRLREK